MLQTKSNKKVSSGITPAQIRMIHAAKRTLGLDEETYRDMLNNIAGVTSSTELDQKGVNALIRHMQTCGFKRTGTQQQDKKRSAWLGPNVIRLASVEQKDKIARLRALIKWRKDDGYTLWLSKRMGMKSVRRASDAYLVIEGLKKMFEHQMEAEYGADWWLVQHADPEIMRYIDEHLSQRLSHGTLRRNGICR